MPTEDIDRRLAQKCADAELAHAAEQYATVGRLVRDGESSQEQLRTVRRRLFEAAQACCQAYDHADAP
jgi:hypothetical protein